MKRCVVQFRDGTYANLPADSMCVEDGMIYAKEADALVAVFDLSAILSVHLSEAKKSGNGG